MPPAARRTVGLAVGHRLLGGALPLYPLYALLFTDAGVSAGGLSVLFAVWSAVGVTAEVPAGALADRFGRRRAIVAGCLLQASGFALWIALPGWSAFVAGFVLWGLGGAVDSGALEALLYDALPREAFPAVLGRVTAAELLAMLPAAGLAWLLFSAGGYAFAGWVSVGFCIGSALLARALPEPAPPADPADAASSEPGYLELLRAGVVEAVTRPAVRYPLLAVALLTGIDAFEEYFPVLADGLAVPTAWVGAATAGTAVTPRIPAVTVVVVRTRLRIMVAPP